MINISSDAIIEKNKITSDGTWLLLLEIAYEGETPLYICLNNESVSWNGYTWLPAIFTLSGIVETKEAEVPNINLGLYDLNRSIIPILEELDGGIGAIVTIRVVHSKYLANTTPELEEVTEVIDVSVDDSAQVTLTLGSENLINRRCPAQKYLKNNCRFIFKKAEVDYSLAGTTDLNNSNYYIKGDTSGNTAKIIEAQIESGAYSTSDATGILKISTINGPFLSETISIYSDSGFTTLVQASAATLSGPTLGSCNYSGSETECNRSFARCKELNNQLRFGGFIGVGVTGFIK